MKRNILIKIACGIALMAVFVSCKAKKELLPATIIPKVMAEEPKTDLAKVAKINAIKLQNTPFQTITMKAKADLSIDNKSNEVNMNIRIRNNEVIWVSVTAVAGLEVARALITPDSVKIINRLDNIYIQKPFSYIYEFTNERINFKTLQAVLLGNAVDEYLSDGTELFNEGDKVYLKSTLASMIYNLEADSRNKVLINQLNDQVAGQELVVGYYDFNAVNDFLIPHTVSMKSKAKNKAISLYLNYLKIEMDSKFDLPFRVPDRFTIKN